MPAMRVTLELQELGERALPSPVALHPVDTIAPVAIVQHAHPLQGPGSGTYQQLPALPDVGTGFNLNGTVNLAGLGTFQVQGEVHGVGFVAWGRATGELVLTSAKGTITLALHGAIQPGFSAIPRELVYSVTGGTGAYSHLTGYGAIGMSLVPAPVPSGHPSSGSIFFRFE
jgi:hypothetical protein